MNNELNSIGLNKKPSDTTVVVAMSGGVDSSTVAGMMKKEGYNVIGITLKLYDDGKEVAASKQCCSGQDIMDAKRVAQKLNIEHKILYYQNKFIIEVKIRMPSLNAFTFFFPPNLFLSNEQFIVKDKLFRFAIIGSSTQ